MKISEFARENDVTVRMLHYYDETGVLRPSQGQGDNGYREYAPEDAQRLQALRLLSACLQSLRDEKGKIGGAAGERYDGGHGRDGDPGGAFLQLIDCHDASVEGL